MALQTGLSHAPAASRAAPQADAPPRPRGEEVPVSVPAEGPLLSNELESTLAPMLGAIVRMAGANAGTVRVVGEDGACRDPVVAIGIPGLTDRAGAQAVAVWCDACAESRDAGSECVKSKLCGHGERIRADVFGSVRLGAAGLVGCVLYGTSRACPACEAAAYRAGIARMYFGAAIADAGAPEPR